MGGTQGGVPEVPPASCPIPKPQRKRHIHQENIPGSTRMGLGEIKWIWEWELQKYQRK